MRQQHDIAVSIEYDDQSESPRIGARGERLVAREMRTIALRYGVPISDNPTLAEHLGKCSPLAGIPGELYEELAYVICDPTRRVF